MANPIHNFILFLIPECYYPRSRYSSGILLLLCWTFYMPCTQILLVELGEFLLKSADGGLNCLV